MNEIDELKIMMCKFCDAIMLCLITLLPVIFLESVPSILRFGHFAIAAILVIAKYRYPLFKRADITLFSFVLLQMCSVLSLIPAEIFGLTYESGLASIDIVIFFGGCAAFLWIDDYYDRQIRKLTDPSWVWKFKAVNRDMNRKMSREMKSDIEPGESVVSLLDGIQTGIIREYILFRLEQSYAIQTGDYEIADALGAIGAKDPIQGMLKSHSLHCKILTKMKEQGIRRSEIVKKAMVYSNYASGIPKYVTEVETALKNAIKASSFFFAMHLDTMMNAQQGEGAAPKEVLEYQSLILILQSMVTGAKKIPIRKIVVSAKAN